MGTTAEAICNTALTMLGEEPILTLSEDNKPARFCNANYDNQRKMVLRAGRGNAATSRATAALIAELFAEVVIAPGADDAARAALSPKKNLRLLLPEALPDPAAPGRVVKSLAGRYLGEGRGGGQITAD